MNKKFQYRISNGDWVDCDKTYYPFENFGKLVLKREEWYAPRVKRIPMKTVEELAEYLIRTGDSINFGDDWYACVRVKPEPIPERVVELVLCDCGHSVPSALVMNASMGQTCPDCYDDWS